MSAGGARRRSRDAGYFLSEVMQDQAGKKRRSRRSEERSLGFKWTKSGCRVSLRVFWWTWGALSGRGVFWLT